MFRQHILQRHAIINDDVISAQVRLGKVTAIIAAVNLHMIRIAFYMNLSLMYQNPVFHSISPHELIAIHKIKYYYKIVLQNARQAKLTLKFMEF
ncbi:hypothetical protein OR1_00130 [Geobacter sp. OR-1]|nr:hypothetical protein OR1_00130 [Geobacter sp. OR-1]